MNSPPPLEGTPKEAIKDSTPADLNADDDAELEEALETGSQMEKTMTQAKVKTKSHILGAFRSVGKKMAGFKGDVAVDGARKQVGPFHLGPVCIADDENLQEQIGDKIDRLVFRGNVKDLGEIDCKCQSCSV